MDQKYADIAQKLAALLSDVVSAKTTLHGYHWNVLGPNFGEYHAFFQTLYSDVDESVDPIAENILKLGYPAPYLLNDLIEMSHINEERLDGSEPLALLGSALRVMEHLYSCHLETMKLAEQHDLQGLMDFLAGRIDIYATWIWQIKAYLGVR